jgi:hypothetical protein
MRVTYASNPADVSAVALAKVEARETDKALGKILKQLGV